jgi:endonuclease G
LIDGITVLYVYFTENTGEEARNACISIKIGNGETTTLTLTQDGQKKSPGTEPGTGTKPQSANAWAEIPAYKENPSYQYVTHLTELNGTAVRNYSICYDKSHRRLCGWPILCINAIWVV